MFSRLGLLIAAATVIALVATVAVRLPQATDAWAITATPTPVVTNTPSPTPTLCPAGKVPGGGGGCGTATPTPLPALLSADLIWMNVGEQGVVQVQASYIDPPGLGAWSIDVSYDATRVSVAACVAEQGGVCNPAFGPNTVRFTGSSNSGLVGATKLAAITFSCDAKGAGPLTLNVNVLVDATPGDPQPIDAIVGDGQVSCASPPPVGGVAVDRELRPLALETNQADGVPWAAVAGMAAAVSLIAAGGAAWYARRAD